jgi:DNA polymerase III epsilon subunit-like protein
MKQPFTNRICAVDIETTGLSIPSKESLLPDEIIQLAIVSTDNTSVFYESFKPVNSSHTPSKQFYCGITYKDLIDKPTFYEMVPSIQVVFDRFDMIISYNIEFDAAFLQYQGINLAGKQQFCMMRAFTHMRMKTASRIRKSRRYSLGQCAQYFGITTPGRAHNALVDARTVMQCYQAMCRMLGMKNREERIYE